MQRFNRGGFMINPKKEKDMGAFSRGYDVGFKEGFKRGMEVARNSFAYYGQDRKSILGSRKYGLSDEMKKKLEERNLPTSILGSRRYGKGALLHYEVEKMARETMEQMQSDDCVCDTGMFCGGDSCDCDSDCDCSGDCSCD